MFTAIFHSQHQFDACGRRDEARIDIRVFNHYNTFGMCSVLDKKNRNFFLCRVACCQINMLLIYEFQIFIMPIYSKI